MIDSSANQIFDVNDTKQRYFADIERRLTRAWRSDERIKECTIEFVLLEDGRVQDVRMFKTSRLATFDEAAVNIIKAVSPYRGIPGSLGVKRLTLRCTFGFKLPKVVNIQECTKSEP
jgi:TonB family protein